MNRRTAKTIHETTNLAYWMENPAWSTGNPALDLVCGAMRKLPFSIHEAQKKLFFKTERLLAVNGESVVAINTDDATKVDKYMFRYPGNTSVEAHHQKAAYEIRAITNHLAGIALPTTVTIEQADIFRFGDPIPAVTQNQQRLDLSRHAELDLASLHQEAHSPARDRTAADLEVIVNGAERLRNEHGYYPDVSHGSGNLRRDVHDGAVTLLDVMPFYESGSRLIGDTPPDVIPHLQSSLEDYSQFVGRYGS